MKLRVAIVDDLPSDADRLGADVERMISQNRDIRCEISRFLSGEAFLAQFSSGAYQIAFLDICMEGMNGIDLAKKLRAADSHLLIVFLTTSREYAFDAFPVHPFDYLVKPYGNDALRRVLAEALRVLSADEPEITIRAAYSAFRVPLETIVSVQSFGHTVSVYTAGGQCIRSIMTFSELERMLTNDPRFLLCNRGILVNMDHVLSLDGEAFRMSEGPACSLRVRDRARLVSAFSQYQISRMKRDVRL